MNKDTHTIQDLISKEYDLINTAESTYGAYFKNAMDFNNLLQTFLKEVDSEAWIFAAFLSQIRKHHTLAIFSEARMHSVQAKMNVRQVIEAGVNAAYGLAFDNQDDFVIKDNKGYLQAPQKLTKKRYKWLEENHKEKSDFLLRQKEIINNSASHSNIIYAFNNFDFSKDKISGFSMPFFDFENDLVVKGNLWFLGNLALGLMDLFNGINKEFKKIKLIDDFEPKLLNLKKENQKLKAEMLNNDRIKSKLSDVVDPINSNTK